MKRDVVLVPGLWMPTAVAALPAAWFARRGYEPRVFDYRGRGPYEENLEALARFARAKARFFVGHSLGGVLIFDMLSRHPEIGADAVVLLGAPVRGCLTGRRFGRTRLGRWTMGGCRPLWEERPARWVHSSRLGVVAGTRGLGLGRLLGTLPGENDGIVRVEETAVEGMAERALVRHGHSVLVVSREVGRLVDRFLAAGRFA